LPKIFRRGPAPSGDVLIHLDGRQWAASRGDVVSIGRSHQCQIRLPDDDHLSRHAGSLRVLEDCVLVRNDSIHKPLVIRPPVGEDRIVEPGAATTSLPYQRFDMLLAGSAGLVVSIQVDAARLTPDVYAIDPQTRAPTTRAEPVQLSAAERRVLLALCAPLLTECGPRSVPATYAQIAQRLDRRPGYIRNVVKSLRETLAGHGIDGLVRDDGSSTHDDFRGPLARLAVRNGWVTRADLDDEPADDDLG
jgi:hypothetical protein